MEKLTRQEILACYRAAELIDGGPSSYDCKFGYAARTFACAALQTVTGNWNLREKFAAFYRQQRTGAWSAMQFEETKANEKRELRVLLLLLFVEANS